MIEADGEQATVEWEGITLKDGLPAQFYNALDDPDAVVFITCRSEWTSLVYSTQSIVVIAWRA